MLDGVGECLLHQPVDSQPDSRRELTTRAGHRERHVEPCAAQVLHQLLDVVETRLWRQGTGTCLVEVAQDADNAAHLVEGSPPDGLDRRECLGRPLGIAGQGAPGGGGLHGHHTDVMCDHVVQLARDARALLGDDGAHVRFASLLQARCP